MAEEILRRAEHVQPLPVRIDASSISRLGFAARRLVDLQLATIWLFLRPELPQLRGTLLDVGCGDMPYRSCLDAEVAYTGMDVPQASAFGMRADHSIVPFDGSSIPFADASFTTVLVTEVLEHAREPAKLISEIHRVLQPGGRVLATVPFAARVHHSPFDFHRFTQFALLEMFSQFRDVAIQERGNDIAVIANKLVVLSLRLSRPSRMFLINWTILLFLAPLVVAFLLFAHVAIHFDFGSKDDPLGYSISGVKRS